MINIDNHKIDIRCPSCQFLNTITLKQVRIRDVIICRGCKVNIRLEDYLNTARKAIRSIRRAFTALEKQIRKTHKMTIRL